MKEIFEMNRNTRRLGIYVTLMLVFTAAASIFRTAACLNDLDYIYGYFNDKTMITVATVIIWAGAAVLASFGAVGMKVSLKPSFSSPMTFVPTGITAAALLFFAVGMVGRIGDIRAAGAGIVPVATGIFTVIFTLCSIVHFFLNAFLIEGKTVLRSDFAVATVLALASYAAYLYFVGGGSLNAPNRITDQMAYLFSALFFLYEARISLGREKWRGYSVFGLLAASMCAYSAIPAVIVYFVYGRSLSASIEETVLTLSLFIFITTRLILTLRLTETEKNKRIGALEEYADERDKAVRDVERRYDEAYAVQLTIADIIPEEEMPDGGDPDEEFEIPKDEPGTVFVPEDEDEDDGQLALVDIFRIDTEADGEGDI